MPTPKPFVPVSGARHQFIAVTSKKIIGHSNVEGNTPAMAQSASDDDKFWWRINLRTDAAPASESGLALATYEMVNVHDGFALECFKGSSKLVRARRPEPESKDNQSFVIVPAETQDRAGQFQLRCQFGPYWLSSSPYSATLSATEDSTSENTWWTATVEYLTFEAISYDISKASMHVRHQPDVLSSKIVRNKSKSSQTASVTLYNPYYLHHMMESTQSIEAAVPGSFKTTVPSTCDGKLTINPAKTASLSVVKPTSQTYNWNETLSVNCDPGVSVKVAALATKVEVAKVPYIATWRSLHDASRNFTTTGSYKGELWWDFHIEFSEAAA